MAEGLLGEVTQLLGARLIIKAADQAHFGGKQVCFQARRDSITRRQAETVLERYFNSLKNCYLFAIVYFRAPLVPK